MNREIICDRILQAATELLTEGGREAVSTRAVCARSGVQSPTIYRIFQDKQGLLDAVAYHGFQSYLAAKAALPATDDPVEDLRRGWDQHVEFGLANPALYTLAFGEIHPGRTTRAAALAAASLAERVRRIAEAGRLRVSEEHAAHLVHSAGRGLTLTLIELPEEQRDPALSPLAREAAIAAVTTGAPAAGPGDRVTAAAVALRAALPGRDVLSAAERALLAEWLERLAAPGAPAA
ncbi:TetR/AcrR family transcriptional regulator [Streptomonospora sp. S1-112]|uniref:TetR/AcrR family transcriptional regulator n=1 Tax=Streptomonospora mangrovi TaxID=2883123 RepID=A0A9X3NTA4_9ACTN|nr:TetR/AcrR family transcriptional regulator [Streptomonospora mangrovi]MDA0567781.1 TetR/AcrR family transcriptional regulator [Streptomonospora mangrovi]